MTDDNNGKAQSRQEKGEKPRRMADVGTPERSGQRSEECYRTLFEHADAAMLLVDGEGKILEINQQACRLLGYERDALLRLHIADLKSEKRYPSASQGVKGGFSVVDEILLHRDGTQIPVGISSVSVTVDGRPLFLWCLKETAKRKSVEVALLGSEQTYRLITENTSDYIALLTLDGICIYVSPAHKNLGYDPSELIGKSGFSMLHREDRRTLLPLIKKYARAKESELLRLEEEGRSERLDFRLPDKSGRWHCMEATANLVRNPETKTHNVLVIYRDVTEYKRHQEQLALSEVRFRELFDNMSSGVAVYEAAEGGEDFVFVDFNRAAERIEGVRKTDLIGKSLIEEFPNAKDFGLYDMLRRVWKTGNPEFLPAKLYKDKKREGWRENYVFKLPSGEIVAVSDNVTERKLTEEALRESERRYRMLFEQMGDALFLETAEGRILDANKSACALFGYTRGELINMTMDDLCPPGAVTFLPGKRGESAHVRQPVETVRRRKDGTLVQVALRGEILEIGGEPRLLVSLRDITDKRWMEEDLRQTLKMKAEFYSHVSHELRNPLNFILGYAQLLALEEELSNDQKRYVRSILAGGERLVTLIEEFFELSKLDSGHEALNRDVHHLREILATVCEDHRLSAQKKGIGLTLLEEEIDDEVSVDLVKFRQAIDNLVENAIKYTPPGGEISIELTKRDRYLHVRIKDNGVGILPGDHDRIFQEFVRGGSKSGGDQQSVPGTGLGLPIAKRIVHLHGGRIELDSEVGKGSVFTVMIPAGKTDDKALRHRG